MSTTIDTIQGRITTDWDALKAELTKPVINPFPRRLPSRSPQTATLFDHILHEDLPTALTIMRKLNKADIVGQVLAAQECNDKNHKNRYGLLHHILLRLDPDILRAKRRDKNTLMTCVKNIYHLMIGALKSTQGGNTQLTYQIQRAIGIRTINYKLLPELAAMLEQHNLRLYNFMPRNKSWPTLETFICHESRRWSELRCIRYLYSPQDILKVLKSDLTLHDQSDKTAHTTGFTLLNVNPPILKAVLKVALAEGQGPQKLIKHHPDIQQLIQAHKGRTPSLGVNDNGFVIPDKFSKAFLDAIEPPTTDFTKHNGGGSSSNGDGSSPARTGATTGAVTGNPVIKIKKPNTRLSRPEDESMKHLEREAECRRRTALASSKRTRALTERRKVAMLIEQLEGQLQLLIRTPNPSENLQKRRQQIQIKIDQLTQKKKILTKKASDAVAMMAQWTKKANQYYVLAMEEAKRGQAPSVCRPRKRIKTPSVIIVSGKRPRGERGEEETVEGDSVKLPRC